MDKFMLKEVVEVPKMGLRALKYQHTPTNLTHLHVEKPGDANRVFSLAFKTDAPDKTGVPHILEHTTLCGSRKFPVRDPFFKMMTRSLANFMNAMTAFDYTYYPFATTNKADFANLQQVYMDSVFAPLLKEQDFQQEGWRLEPAELASEASPLVFKGVVYNEMKGQMSMPSYQYYMAWFMALYPSMQYSAGDPMHIPSLRYADLVKFHRDHYNPSNCFTFSYGDFPAEEAITPLTEYLDGAENRVADSYVHGTIPRPVELAATTTHRAEGPLDPMIDAQRQHKVSLTWYVGAASDLTQTMVWRVLGLLLTDGHASPFYQALIDSGIGPEFSVNTGFEETPAKLLFTIGLEGIDEAKVPQFKQAVFDTVERIIAEGFAPERVDALLHQAELADREVDANYGMNLLHKMVGRAFHPNGDFMKIVDNEKLLNAFKEKLAENPRLFQDELRQHIGKDKPYFQFEMAPSPSYDADRAAAEQKLLADKLATMTDDDKALAITKAKELEQATRAKQNLNVLPTVTTGDISRDIRKYPVTDSKLLNQVPLKTRETGTQGISYVRLMRDLSALPKDLVPYLMLYPEALTSVGTKNHSMAELEDLIKLNTGNISASAAVRAWGNLELGYGASALDSKLPQMYALLTELITEPTLDNVSKLKVILDSSAANFTNALSDSGHRYAISRAAAALSPHKAAGDQLSGFTYIKLIQQLSGKSEDELRSELVPKLQQIHSLPWAFRGVGLTQTKALGVHDTHVSQLEKLITGLGATVAPAAPTVSELYAPSTQSQIKTQWPTGPHKTMVSLPSFQVSHVGSAVRGSTDSLNNKDHAALQVLANLLTHKHLHTQIREKGGAYGGGAKYDALDGVFSMFSYRDPTPDNTREVMLNAGKWAASHKFSERDVEEGKIGIFQSVDSPISPRNEIMSSLGIRSTDEERQLRRENLLNVTPADLNRVAEQYLMKNLENEGDNAICVIGPGSTPSGWTSIEL